ncbi:response regulator [Shigella flexneri]
MILLNVNMPGMNGLETWINCAKSPSPGASWYFSVSNHEEDVVTALKRGADGYPLKDMEPKICQSIASGSCWRNGIKRSINACSGGQLAR